LGEGKIADDPSVTTSASSQACEFILLRGMWNKADEIAGLVAQATDMAKQAYTAVVGESK
jgi:hypothetical protein